MRNLMKALSLVLIFAFCPLSTCSAAFILQIKGDGVLSQDGESTQLGMTSLTFTYSPLDFSTGQIFSFDGNSTGTRWLANTPIAVNIKDGSGNIYAVNPIGGVSMYDQPSSFDQLNWETQNTNPVAQWNDGTSAVFGPVSANFPLMHQQFINALNSPQFLLSNGSTSMLPVLGMPNTTIEIQNATASVRAVPEPSSSALLALSGFVLGLRKIRSKNSIRTKR